MHLYWVSVMLSIRERRCGLVVAPSEEVAYQGTVGKFWRPGAVIGIRIRRLV